MLIQVTETGRKVTFNSHELVWVETITEDALDNKGEPDKHAGKTRIVLKAGFIFADQTQDQVIAALLGKPGLRMEESSHASEFYGLVIAEPAPAK